MKTIKIILTQVLILAICTGVQAQNYTTYNADNANIQYEGRIDFTNPLKPKFAFPGVSIKVKFTGTAAKVTLIGYDGLNWESNYFNVIIDGAFVKKFAVGTGTVTEVCQTGLSNEEHTLEIFKRTESEFGKVEFVNFEIDGTLLAPDAKPDRKIEFIGNSITCGYGNEDVSTGGHSAIKENNYLAYGAVCSRLLNAQYRATSYSGRGMAFNYGCNEGDVVPEIYEKYFADDASGGTNQYNHSSYTPDVIVINLGTNDHACYNTTDENYKTAYKNFITKLKGYHPQAKILCLTGPMNTTDIFKNRVEAVVNESGGAENEIYFFHQTQTIDESYAGGHWHPNTIMADYNANEVANFIEENMLFEAPTTPVIGNINSSPANPTSDDEVIISARVTDDISISSATLNWGTVSGNLSNSINMTVDGNTYSATIPAQDDGTTIYYEITATDGDNNTTNSQEHGYSVSNTTYIPFADYDNIELAFTGFGGSIYSKTVNPAKAGINTSSFVAKTEKFANSETWAGIFSETLTEKLDFTTNSVYSMKIYAPKACTIMLKLEDADDSNIATEITATNTKTNEWEELTFNLEGESSDTYNKIVLFFDYGNGDASNFYYDDIKFIEPSVITVEEKIDESNVRLYPNPVQSQLNINLIDIDQSNISITSINGQVVYKQQTTSASLSINVEDLTPGVYFLKVNTSNNIITKKILVL